MAIPRRARGGRRCIDGASRIGFFWRILLPLSGPGMVTVGVLAFVASWNAYLLPLLLLQERHEDAAARRRRLLLASTPPTPPASSRSRRLAMIPALVFFLAMQRRIVNGLQGAVKG